MFTKKSSNVYDAVISTVTSKRFQLFNVICRGCVCGVGWGVGWWGGGGGMGVVCVSVCVCVCVCVWGGGLI